MKLVHPIRDAKMLEDIKQYLKERNERDYVLFVAGINTGLRIQDLLKLKVGDVRGIEIQLVEMKTGKPKEVPINKAFRKALTPFIKGRLDDEYLFLSRQKDKQGKVKHINRSTAYRIIKNAAIDCGFRNNCGNHTMRKTFGFWHYKNNNNIAALQKIFNHDKEITTYRYIGLEKDYLDKTYMDLNL